MVDATKYETGTQLNISNSTQIKNISASGQSVTKNVFITRNNNSTNFVAGQQGTYTDFYNQMGQGGLKRNEYLNKYGIAGPMDNGLSIFGGGEPTKQEGEGNADNQIGQSRDDWELKEAAANADLDNGNDGGGVPDPNITDPDTLGGELPGAIPESDWIFRGNLDMKSMKAGGLDPKLYNVNNNNQYTDPATGKPRAIGWDPTVGRGLNDNDMLSLGNKAFFQFDAQKIVPVIKDNKSLKITGNSQANKFKDNRGKETWSSHSYFPTSNQPSNVVLPTPTITTIPGNDLIQVSFPDKEQKQFKDVKGGPMFVETTKLNQAGLQTQYNKQQSNRAYNSIIKEWQTTILRVDPKNSQVKAKAFIDKKTALIDSWQGPGGSGLGSYKKMFKQDLKDRYSNLYGSSTSPFNQKQIIKNDPPPQIHIRTPQQSDMFKPANYANPNVNPVDVSGQINNNNKNTNNKNNNPSTYYMDYYKSLGNSNF